MANYIIYPQINDRLNPRTEIYSCLKNSEESRLTKTRTTISRQTIDNPEFLLLLNCRSLCTSTSRSSSVLLLLVFRRCFNSASRCRDLTVDVDCCVAAQSYRTPAKIYLASFWFRYARHIARLRRRRRAYAPLSNTASHDNHKKMNSRVSFYLP